MTSATATPNVSTKFIEQPAGVTPGDWQAEILNASNVRVAQSFGQLPLPAINVSTLPSGSYTLRVSRRTTDLGYISSSSIPLVLDQTVEVPNVVTVTLA